jgi:hypothetical protein
VQAAAAPPSKHAAALPRGVSADASFDSNFTPEINVIGATVDQATDFGVDKFLDKHLWQGETVTLFHAATGRSSLCEEQSPSF